MQVYILIEHYHQEDIMGESLGCSLKVKGVYRKEKDALKHKGIDDEIRKKELE